MLTNINILTEQQRIMNSFIFEKMEQRVNSFSKILKVFTWGLYGEFNEIYDDIIDEIYDDKDLYIKKTNKFLKFLTIENYSNALRIYEELYRCEKNIIENLSFINTVGGDVNVYHLFVSFQLQFQIPNTEEIIIPENTNETNEMLTNVQVIPTTSETNNSNEINEVLTNVSVLPTQDQIIENMILNSSMTRDGESPLLKQDGHDDPSYFVRTLITQWENNGNMKSVRAWFELINATSESDILRVVDVIKRQSIKVNGVTVPTWANVLGTLAFPIKWLKDIAFIILEIIEDNEIARIRTILKYCSRNNIPFWTPRSAVEFGDGPIYDYVLKNNGNWEKRTGNFLTMFYQLGSAMERVNNRQANNRVRR